jgi:hypothetical protein
VEPTPPARRKPAGRAAAPAGGPPPPLWGEGWTRGDRVALDKLWSVLTEARRLKREAPGPMLGSMVAFDAAEYVIQRAEAGQGADGRMATNAAAIQDATESLRAKVDRAREELGLTPFAA